MMHQFLQWNVKLSLHLAALSANKISFTYSYLNLIGGDSEARVFYTSEKHVHEKYTLLNSTFLQQNLWYAGIFLIFAP